MKFSPEENQLKQRLLEIYSKQKKLLLEEKELMGRWIKIREKSIMETVQRV